MGTSGYKRTVFVERSLSVANVFEYLGYELASFDERPVNAIDAAIFSQAAMIDGAGIVPSVPRTPAALSRLRTLVAPAALRAARFEDLARAERFDTMFTGFVPEDLKKLLFALIASPRFRDMRLIGYKATFDETTHTQFSATTYLWRDSLALVAFRGTDTSFCGWRENFDMTYKPVVRAQRLARSYLETMAAHLPCPLVVCGHSKGGNLALFAALTAAPKVQSRIEHVWALDAPGFKAGAFDEDAYRPLEGRITRIVPQDSIVGMLLEHHGGERCVESFAAGLDEHSVFSWETYGEDFVARERVNDASQALRAVAAEWLASMDDARKEQVVEAIFAAIAVSGAKSAVEIFAGGPELGRAAARALRELDPDERDLLTQEFGNLAGIVARRVGQDVASALFDWMG